jgi:uncharacterized SAM-binding protein YcdF (DUF218 family)
MSRITFFRLRRIWLPTMFGWIVLLLLSIVTSILIVRNIYAFLAQNEPVGARILVIEGWLAPEELDQAVKIYKKGGYERVVTTGGPISGWPELIINTDYAKVSADYLAKHGVPRDAIIIVPTPSSAQERTFLSAVVLRESARNLGIVLDSFDVFSSGAHSRRSRLLYQMAFGPNVRIGILAARPAFYDSEAWWRASNGVEAIIFQSIGLLWVKCCFWPGALGSQQEH